MKLAAVMMVRNEAPIITDSIGHLLHGVDVDRLYVADNGSTDQTAAILHRIAGIDPRVQVRAAPGAFHQPQTIGQLVREAMADGADWLLPNDADEFLWMDGPALRARCAAAGGIGGFPLRVSNFVQFRGRMRDRPGSIETMLFRAIPEGSVQAGQTLVEEHGLPFVRINYPCKLLLRSAGSLALHPGQHVADGMAGPLAPEPIGELLHAPIRARDDLADRVMHGRRLAEIATQPGHSWHLKRLVGMDRAALDAEWRANSVRTGWPQAGLRPDLRLHRVARRVRAFRQHVLGSRHCGQAT